MPEGPKIAAKCREQGWCSWGGGEHWKLPQQGLGPSPGRIFGQEKALKMVVVVSFTAQISHSQNHN